MKNKIFILLICITNPVFALTVEQMAALRLAMPLKKAGPTPAPIPTPPPKVEPMEIVPPPIPNPPPTPDPDDAPMLKTIDVNVGDECPKGYTCLKNVKPAEYK